MLRMSGAIQQSTGVMKAMQGLLKIPEIQGAMMDLSREMEKVTFDLGSVLLILLSYIHSHVYYHCA